MPQRHRGRRRTTRNTSRMSKTRRLNPCPDCIPESLSRPAWSEETDTEEEPSQRTKRLKENRADASQTSQNTREAAASPRPSPGGL